MDARRQSTLAGIVILGALLWVAWVPLLLFLGGAIGVFGDSAHTRVVDGIVAVVIVAAMLALRELLHRLDPRRRQQG